MELSVVFKDMDPQPEVVERLEAKLQRIEERLGRPIVAKAVLLQSRNRCGCQIRFPWFKKEFVAAASGWDWVTVVDEAAEKVGRQLARKEDRLAGRRDGRTLRSAEGVAASPAGGAEGEDAEEHLPEFEPEEAP